MFFGKRWCFRGSEAYTAGLWKSNDLVKLVQIILKNKSIMNDIDSGISKSIVNLINSIIHKLDKIHCQEVKKISWRIMILVMNFIGYG